MDKVWLLYIKSKRMRIKKTFSNAKKIDLLNFFFEENWRVLVKNKPFLGDLRSFEEENRNWGDLRRRRNPEYTTCRLANWKSTKKENWGKNGFLEDQNRTLLGNRITVTDYSVFCLCSIFCCWKTVTKIQSLAEF